ncbi:hypothetical protein [Succinimonas sp.]|uniref:hypothetical protein n=1 Tax=Succinimonas sp. TaxID=1936151 RepID=UPI00386728DA
MYTGNVIVAGTGMTNCVKPDYMSTMTISPSSIMECQFTGIETCLEIDDNFSLSASYSNDYFLCLTSEIFDNDNMEDADIADSINYIAKVNKTVPVTLEAVSVQKFIPSIELEEVFEDY